MGSPPLGPPPFPSGDCHLPITDSEHTVGNLVCPGSPTQGTAPRPEVMEPEHPRCHGATWSCKGRWPWCPRGGGVMTADELVHFPLIRQRVCFGIFFFKWNCSKNTDKRGERWNLYNSRSPCPKEPFLSNQAHPIVLVNVVWSLPLGPAWVMSSLQNL